MTLDEIHELLSEDLGLVIDLRERGGGRTYFLNKVSWIPTESTRVCRVLWNASEDSKEAMSVQLCVSSDNNQLVFIRPPFVIDRLRVAVIGEIAQLNDARSRFNIQLHVDAQARP